MKLRTRIWVLTSAIIGLIMAGDYFVGMRGVEQSIRVKLEINARDIRAILMATRRVYHEQFLASGLPLNDKTIGFLPAHALSRISSDFPNWSKSTLSFNNVSDRPRNPANRADPAELEAMAWFRANPVADERVAEIRGSGGKRFYHYTAPIWMEPYCIRCHGDRKEAPASIAQSYEEAFGYQAGDLRGVMSIKLPIEPLRDQEIAMWKQRYGFRLGGYLVLLVFLGTFLNRMVASRLARLEQAAGRLASGNYDERIRLPGKETDEVGTLATAFNRMAEGIQERDLALKETEERYRTATEHMRDGFVLIRGEKGKVVWWNRAAEAIFGYARDEIIGKPLHDFVVPPERREAAIDAGLVRFSRDGYGPIIGRTLELRALHKDGHRFDVELSLSAVFLHGAWHAVGVVRDITDRKQAEAELWHYRVHLEDLVNQRAAELNSLFEALPDLYFRMKRDGTILDYRAGQGGAELYVEPGSFLGKRMQDVLPPEVGARFKTAFDGLSDAPRITVIEYDLPTPAGQRFYEARLQAFTGDEIIAVVRNVTERKGMESARESARREAERLAHVKSEFLANMSHEIRTPLNGVLGMAQIGYRDSPSESKIHETFGRIMDSGNLLLGIINDILDFSKIEAGKLQVERVPVDLDRVIGEAVGLLLDRAQAKGIAIRVEKAPDLPAFCLGDPLRLTQILVNLLSNAVKFTDRGQVTVAAGREGDILVLNVTDTGVGIDTDLIGRLFVPFEQADGSTTRRFGGTGLGLTITGRLVEMMGGAILVDSHPGEGSRFEVRLPLAEAEAPLAGAPEPAKPVERGQRLAGLRILAAEDNEVNRLVLEDMLAFEGAQVVIVENGRKAVERIQAQGGDAFDIVLMDIQMPEMDGYEATRRILERAPGLPVVGQTAHALAEEHDKCLLAGMVGVLVKPLQEERLVAEVLRLARRDGRAAPRESLPMASPGDVPAASSSAGTWGDWPALRARYGRKPGFLIKLMDVSVSSHADTAEKLRQSARAGDIPQMVYLAHSIKGMAGTILANGLMEQAKAAEMAARSGGADAAPRCERLAVAFESLLREIETQRSS